jgi:type IV pilus assembly protein PilA
MKTLQKGFTLIELMIVIAIIGILAAIAIPAYQNYLIRSQVTEGLSLADGWKTAVSEFYAEYGTFPSGSSATGSATSIAVAGNSTGKYVSGITVVAGGELVVLYSGPQANAALTGKQLTLNPGLSSNNDIVWVCGLATAPATLATAPVGASVTTIASQYLPASCHS